jgi:pyruvate/2-oxoglutarate dehydrogenase complex dihydrolipoamide dehydrogenase (E3) component
VIRQGSSHSHRVRTGHQLAGREDADVGEALFQLFHDEGIAVHLQTQVRSVEGESGRQVRVVLEGPSGESVFEGTDLLVGVGRTPNTAGVGLELAGVKLTEAGYVVDEHLATTAENVWAMGECAGSPQFTHVAFDGFRVVYANLSGDNSTTTDRLVPYCMYTDPELARVGHNDSEAKRLGIGYRLLTMPMSAVLRRRTLSEPAGFMKILIASDNDETRFSDSPRSVLRPASCWPPFKLR